VPLEDSTDADAAADADDSDDIMSRSDTPQPPWTVIPLTDMFSADTNPSNSTNNSSTNSSKPSKKKSSKKKNGGGEADANKDPSLPGTARPLAPSTTAFLARAARGPQALQAPATGTATGETAGSVTVSDEPLAAALTRDVARDLTRVVQAASGAGGSTPAVSANAAVRFLVCCLMRELVCRSSTSELL
jgi:hypothetical protein